ncbi:MAG: deoxyuridine 5'-triphosphate nucleotidohydrolase [Candidatus Wukongarchaeota archaeon]|nr:deoxyuridine 5'-triphosphate nucleotidohydrolase [Candidatus Wukongarchaeota archaeon]MDO8128735.1 deoxyuridine 5'-triphosphate nucleotidohydrolase [Candidatus Wukongarchaeota archaeon]
MTVLPPFLLNKKTLQNMLDPRIQIQPAGFDLTLSDVEKIENDEGIIDFSNEQRKIPKGKKIEHKNGFYTLEPGGYRVRYKEIVNVPEDCIAILLPRSSLLRCGATVCSAVWDPGYKGRGQGLLIVTNKIRLSTNARIAQIIFLKLAEKAEKKYEGKYLQEGL